MACFCKYYSSIAKDYNELLEKYTLLCVKVANILDQTELEKSIKDINPGDPFMNGIYVYLDNLTSVERLQARIIFQKLLYKYCFEPNITIVMPNAAQLKGWDEITTINDPIKLYLSDEIKFYSAYDEYLKNIEPRHKLKFQIELTHALADFIANSRQSKEKLLSKKENDVILTRESSKEDEKNIYNSITIEKFDNFEQDTGRPVTKKNIDDNSEQTTESEVTVEDIFAQNEDDKKQDDDFISAASFTTIKKLDDLIVINPYNNEEDDLIVTREIETLTDNETNDNINPTDNETNDNINPTVPVKNKKTKKLFNRQKSKKNDKNKVVNHVTIIEKSNKHIRNNTYKKRSKNDDKHSDYMGQGDIGQHSKAILNN